MMANALISKDLAATCNVDYDDPFFLPFFAAYSYCLARHSQALGPGRHAMAPETRLGGTIPDGASSLVRPSHFLIRAVGGLSRFLLSRWCNSVQVRGMERFLRLLQHEQRVNPAGGKEGPRGIITYTNHISVMDDPTIFGAFPRELLRQSHTTRWTLGASDIMFTNPFFSWIFRSGQVLPTDRGRGVFQPSLDRSIDLLERGGWVHIFPEGYVNMSRKARVRRFKWGIARMVMEAASKTTVSGSLGASKRAAHSPAALRPHIVPIWISGFDAMMPEPRGPPRWMPRPGADVSITIGDPVNDKLEPVLNHALAFAAQDCNPLQSAEEGSAALQAFFDEIPTLSPHYTIPTPDLFTERTPLKGPPEGVSWPVPASHSRSACALAAGLDSNRARLARSFVAAELRAHLVRLGEESGMSSNLAHRLIQEGDST